MKMKIVDLGKIHCWKGWKSGLGITKDSTFLNDKIKYYGSYIIDTYIYM